MRQQLKELMKNPPDGVSVGLKNDDDLFVWTVMVEGPSDTDYEGGYFQAELKFPKARAIALFDHLWAFSQDFPVNPPEMRFISPMWHPNIYADGKVCISILHEAKFDAMNEQEQMSEKWRPIISVEAVILSVQSMLGVPNFSSPANIDASVELRNDPRAYRARIRKLVRQTQDAL